MKNDVYGTNTVADRPRSQARTPSSTPEIDPQEMMRKMEAAGTPGPAHKALEAFEGNWKAEVKCWHGPGAEPQISHGTAEVKWTLNGRFLEEKFQGEMMGKPFRGISLMGYDNTKQTFNTVWVSDMQTSMFVSEGKGENGNTVITLEGKADCPATGRKDVPMKTVFRVISPDKHVFEMYDGNQKTMEITYTRQ
jgi:hypothetical protein